MRNADGRLIVLAGVNGAGKSTIAGRRIRAGGIDFSDPDAWAAELRAANPALTAEAANGLAWRMSVRRLLDAIERRGVFAFETTLGGRSVPKHIEDAARAGMAVHMWYIGLDSVERHLERIDRRVNAGGHAIPADKVRERYQTSRNNLIRLLPFLTELVLYDNSRDVRGGERPLPVLLAHHRRGKRPEIINLASMPTWAKPIAEALLRL